MNNEKENSQHWIKENLFNIITVTLSIIAIYISLLANNTTKEISESSSLQYEKINNARNNILEQQNQKIYEFQESIKTLNDKQLSISKETNMLSKDYNKLYMNIENMKKSFAETQMILDFMSASALSLRCEVPKESSIKILSYGATEVYNKLSTKKSKILLLDYIANISTSRICNNKTFQGFKILLKGINLSNLNLNGVDITKLYCDNCITNNLSYSYSNGYYTKKEDKCITEESNGKNSLDKECGFDYSPYRYIDFKYLNDK